jgi:phage protein D
MKFITDQYRENGEKLLHQAAQKRSEEKAIMARKLDQRKEEMVAVYTEAKGLADRTKQAMKNAPLSGIDKQWRTTCATVQAQIDKGKMASEGRK